MKLAFRTNHQLRHESFVIFHNLQQIDAETEMDCCQWHRETEGTAVHKASYGSSVQNSLQLWAVRVAVEGCKGYHGLLGCYGLRPKPPTFSLTFLPPCLPLIVP